MPASSIHAISDPSFLGFCPTRLKNIDHWMQRYIDEGKLAGATTLIARHGEIAYANAIGKADVTTGQKWNFDTILRFYSMTKPITIVAMMQLYEKGLFRLDDPVENYLPDLKNMQMLIEGATNINQTVPTKGKMTIHQLMLHTAGFTYGFNADVVADAYVTHKTDFDPCNGSAQDVLKRLSQLPLQFEPGSRWNYGVNTDVLGILVEIISGKSLDHYFKDHIFDPLGMTDTSFEVPTSKLDRFTSLYVPTKENGLHLFETAGNSLYNQGKVQCFSGGGGLLSTAGDYLKFTEMMRQKGQYRGEKLLGSRTVAQITSNHLDGDLASMGQSVFSEISFKGIGFGLGVWSMLNPNLAGLSGSMGDYGWGGAASTAFWVDPKEDMVVIFLTQLLPSSHYPLRKELRAQVYQALLD